VVINTNSRDWYALLDQEDSRTRILRARQAPWLRERLLVLLAGGYEKRDVEPFLLATISAAM
jgi:hypothetical protein